MATIIDGNYSWQPLPGPEFERVMLCGYKEPHGKTAGYWWYMEGSTTESGMAFECPAATHWCPIILPPFLMALEDDNA